MANYCANTKDFAGRGPTCRFTDDLCIGHKESDDVMDQEEGRGISYDEGIARRCPFYSADGPYSPEFVSSVKQGIQKEKLLKTLWQKF